MADPETIYRGLVGEEAGAVRARGRTRPPSQICNDWQQALAAGDAARFGDVVDVQGYTENCLGLTGWTTGFEVALRNLQRNVLRTFRDLAMKVEEVVEGETAVAIRSRLEGTYVGEFLGIAPTGRRVAWDTVIIVHTRDGRVAGMWSQPDLYGIYRQLTA